MATKLSKHSNATNGKKAHYDNQYIKVGRVRMNSWMSSTIPVADIYISERELVHIATNMVRNSNSWALMLLYMLIP